MPTFLSTLLKQLQKAKKNNESARTTALETEIQSYTYSEETYESRIMILEDFIKNCLQPSFLNEINLIIQAIENNYDSVHNYLSVVGYVSESIFDPNYQKIIVTILNSAKFNLSSKTGLLRINSSNIEQLIAIPELFSEEEINKLYMYNAKFMDIERCVQIANNLAKSGKVTQINIRTIDAIKDLKTENFSTEKLAQYISEGIKVEKLLTQIITYGKWDIFSYVIKHYPKFITKHHLYKIIKSAGFGMHDENKIQILSELLMSVDIDLGPSDDAVMCHRMLTPLEWAIGHDVDINFLINSSKDIHLNHVLSQAFHPSFRRINIENESALSLALFVNNLDAANSLLALPGIDVALPDNKPFQYALNNEYYEIAFKIMAKTPKNSPQYLQQVTLMKDYLMNLRTKQDEIKIGEILQLIINNLPEAQDLFNNVLRHYIVESTNLHEVTQCIFNPVLLNNAAAQSSIANALKELPNNILREIEKIAYFDRPCELEYLLKNVPEINQQDLFEKIIFSENIEMLKVILDHFESNIVGTNLNASYHTNLTPLMIMLKWQKSGKNNQALIDFLIESRHDINVNHVVNEHDDPIFKINNHSILSYAIENKMYDLAHKLIERSDIDVTVPNNLPFIKAIDNGDYELAKLIKQKDPQHVLASDETKELIKNKIFDNIFFFEEESLSTSLELGVKLDVDNYIIFNTLQQRRHATSEGILKILAQYAKENAYIHGHHALKAFYLAQGMPRTPYLDHQALLNAITNNDAASVELILNNGGSASMNDSEALIKAASAIPVSLRIITKLLDCGASPKAYGYQLPLVAVNNWLTNSIDTTCQLLTLLLKDIMEPEVIEDMLIQASSFASLKEAITSAIKGSLPSSEKLAFTILEVKSQIEEQNKRNEVEGAMDASLTTRANRLWNEMHPAVVDKFNQYPGNTPLEKIASIEKEIKAFISDEMVNNASHSLDPKDKELIRFIKTNKAALIENADQDIIQQMRAMAISVEDNTHIAWRGYDPLAPTDSQWPNLLVPSTNLELVYTTAASFDGETTAKNASDELRMRVAFAFIANPNPQNFLQQLADMRRAPGHANTLTQDSPSCAPGAIGRWGKIFEEGNIEGKFKLPPSRHEIMINALNSIVYAEFSKQIKQASKTEINKLYFSLTTLVPNIAADVVMGKAPFDEDLYACREAFVQNLGPKITIIEEINKALIKQGEPPLHAQEEIYLDYELLCLGTSGRSLKMAELREEKLTQLKTQKSKQTKSRVEHLGKLYEISIAKSSKPINPFKPSPMMTKQFLPNIFEKVIKQFIEFEVLKELINKQFATKGLSNQKISEITEFLVRETFAQIDIEDNHGKISAAANEFFIKYSKELDISKEEQADFIHAYSKITSFNGLNNEQANLISKKILDSMHSQYPEFNEKLRNVIHTVIQDMLAKETQSKMKYLKH